jgi:hypothetical protein
MTPRAHDSFMYSPVYQHQSWKGNPGYILEFIAMDIHQQLRHSVQIIHAISIIHYHMFLMALLQLHTNSESFKQGLKVSFQS